MSLETMGLSIVGFQHPLYHSYCLCLIILVCCAGNKTAQAVTDVCQIADIVKHNAFGPGELFKLCCLLELEILHCKL